MAVRYFLPNTDSTRLYRMIGTDIDGTYPTNLINGLRSSGLSVGRINDLSFGKIRTAINKGMPLIVDVKRDHWVLIYGYGIGPNRVFIADPRPFGKCVHSWREARRLIYLDEPALVIGRK